MTNPRVLTRMTSSNASSGSSTTPPVRYASAALVKFTCIPSRRPNVSTASLTIETTEVLVGAIERHTAHALTRRIEVGGDARRQLGVEVADHEPSALIGIAHGQAITDAAQPRNDDNFVVQQTRHRSDPSRWADVMSFRSPSCLLLVGVRLRGEPHGETAGGGPAG